MRKLLATILFLFILIIFNLSLVDSEVQTLGTFKLNENVTLLQTCANCTYVNISYVTYPNSTFAIYGDFIMTKSGTRYNYTFDKTSALGQYVYCGYGDVDGLKTIFCVDFMVTKTGDEASSGSSILYIGLLAVIIIFFILCIYSFVAFDNLLNRVGMIGLGYLLLIAISFIGWNMASDYLLSVPFIASFLKITFYVLMAGLLPLIIGGFVWYILMIGKIKEIQDLMNKGLSFDESERRVNRSKK